MPQPTDSVPGPAQADSKPNILILAIGDNDSLGIFQPMHGDFVDSPTNYHARRAETAESVPEFLSENSRPLDTIAVDPGVAA
ncbi:hypothetical protein EG328_007733 [Venturia inaequalis]|uniref:Uncharacterized protein n=1 Tax=Venturia inaequalis TaxID=5025 RepID=A0A8H3VKH3_VENIN|nr:hypothetical protein EG328_007733 [Venturia inaequalis]KAE9989466.1 hypothetical protein EG327_002658 [Venturia inaequalis]